MGRINDLIAKIDNKLQPYAQTFKMEFYNPEASTSAMPQNEYTKLVGDLQSFDANYKKFKEMRINKDSLDEKGKEQLEEIKTAMVKAAEDILDRFSRFKDYSTYRNELAKVGAQLADLKNKTLKIFDEKSDR
ncbi:MAG: hypothetical protein ACI4PR_03465 [Acutalibacteraceae bacterium]